MKITKLTLENFKSVGKAVSIELKPITLLFGPNSVGKSTILQALQYMREVLEFRNVNVDRTSSGGSSVDLGGFENLVHGHNVSREIRIRLDVRLDDDGLPPFGPQALAPDLYESVGGGFIAENALRQVETIMVEVSIGQSHDYGIRPTRYEVGINGDRFAELSLGAHDRPHLSFLNLEPWLVAEDEELDAGDLFQLREFQVAMNDYFEDLADGEPPETLNLDAQWKGGVIPDWNKLLPFQLTEAVPHDTDTWVGAPAIDCLLSRALVGCGSIVLRELQEMRYLGPIREVPPRNYIPIRTPDASRWASGLAAWDILHQLDENDIRVGVSRWLKDPEKVQLGMGYSIKLLKYYELPVDSVIIRTTEKLLGVPYTEDMDVEGAWGELLDDELVELKKNEKKRLRIMDLNRGIEVSLQDVGAGVAQVIPVVIGAVHTGCSVFAVEQPELHVHPKIQCQLGDIFAKEVGERDDRIFLIETHSEHLILRLLRRIRESSEKELPTGAPPLAKENLNVCYLNQEGGELRITSIPVTDDGDFDEPWPEGFFDERLEELM